jgi:hypothetical protein
MIYSVGDFFAESLSLDFLMAAMLLSWDLPLIWSDGHSLECSDLSPLYSAATCRVLTH